MVQKIFFFGAGASREAGVPTQKEIWEQIEKRWERTGDPKIREILDFATYLNFGRSGTKVSINTAELLTIIDLTLEQNVCLGEYDGDVLHRIRENLVHEICQVLDNAVKRENYDHLKGFCNWVSVHDAIISLNYDTVMDCLISDYIGGVNYGFSFTGGLGEANLINKGRNQLLLKPHGSLNWRYCKRCNSIYRVMRKVKDDIYIKCPWDQHYLNEVIVTPSYHKRFLVPQLHDVWIRCFYEIKNADIIFFAGYSFPPGDIHIIHLIKRAILAGNKMPKIIIVSRDSQEMVLNRCQNIFAKFKYYKTSFRDYFCVDNG